jgi:hypothetical protein
MINCQVYLATVMVENRVVSLEKQQFLGFFEKSAEKCEGSDVLLTLHI